MPGQVLAQAIGTIGLVVERACTRLRRVFHLLGAKLVGHHAPVACVQRVGHAVETDGDEDPGLVKVRQQEACRVLLEGHVVTGIAHEEHWVVDHDEVLRAGMRFIVEQLLATHAQYFHGLARRWPADGPAR